MEIADALPKRRIPTLASADAEKWRRELARQADEGAKPRTDAVSSLMLEGAA